MVVAGQTLTFQVVGNITLSLFNNSTAQTVREAAVNDLAKRFARVVEVSLTVNGLIDSAVRWEWLTSPYSARVVVVTKEAYGTAGDVGSIVAHSFYLASGSVPTVSVVGLDQAAGAGVSTTSSTLGGLGSSITAAIDGAISRIGAALGGSVDKANSVLQGNAIILIGGVLILAYIVAGPGGRNVGAVARAARP